MHLNFGWIKENPGKTATIVGIGAIALYLIYSHSANGSVSVSAPGGVSDSVAQAEIASGTQLQLAGMAATQQNNQYAANFQALQEQDATSLALATLQAQLAELNISAGSVVSLEQIDAQKTVDLAQISAGVASTQINADYQAAIAATAQSAALALGIAETNANVSIAGINAAQNVGIAQAMTSAQIAIAQYQAKTQIAIAKYQYKGLEAAYAGQGVGNILGGVAKVVGAIF